MAVKGSFNLLLHKRAGVVGKTSDAKVSSTSSLSSQLQLQVFLPVTQPDIKGLRALNQAPTPTLKIGFFFSVLFLPMNSFSLRFRERLKSSMAQNMGGDSSQ